MVEGKFHARTLLDAGRRGHRRREQGVTGRRTLRIALPGLAELAVRSAEDCEPPRLPAAEWLLARGRRESAVMSAWRDWLLAGADLGPGVLDRFPAGPSARRLAPGHLPGGTWARAEPVHLLTAIDHLQLAAPVPLLLDADEADALVATLNDHFAGSGFVFQRTSGPGWLCECPSGVACASVEPVSAVGRNLRDLLPTGRDATRVRAVMNEIQMLLHQHPVNQRRAERGLAAVNSVWLWGVGTAAMPEGAACGTLLTDDEWLAGLWSLHGGSVQSVDDLAAELDRNDGDLRVALVESASSASAAAQLRRVEQSVLAPVRAALAAGRVSSVAVHTGTATFEVAGAARWSFWRRPRAMAEVLA
jgi:hypothetical protein